MPCNIAVKKPAFKASSLRHCSTPRQKPANKLLVGLAASLLCSMLIIHVIEPKPTPTLKPIKRDTYDIYFDNVATPNTDPTTNPIDDCLFPMVKKTCSKAIE